MFFLLFYYAWLDNSKINMIDTQNLPFQYEDYFSQIENLEHLRQNIKGLVNKDIETLQELLITVQDTLSIELHQLNQQPISPLQQKEIQLALFKQLSQQNRERSESLTGLAQLIMHMIDYIQQSHHRYAFLAENYEKQIDSLREHVQELRSGKSLIENDVQIFKEQLEQARDELEILGEEKEEEDELQDIIEVDCGEKNIKIDQLKEQLALLQKKLSFYKDNQKSRNYQTPERQKTLSQTFSQRNFFLSSTYSKPHQSPEFNHYIEFNKVLLAENNQLRKKIEQFEQMKTSMKQTASSETYQGYIDNIENNNSEPSDTDQGYLKERMTLKYIQSKHSFSSRFPRNSSSLIFGTEENPKNQLCVQISRNSFDFDIVPDCLQSNLEKRLIYLNDGENSLCHDQSRSRFDFMDNHLQTLYEAQQSDKSNRQPLHQRKVFQRKPKLGNPTRFLQKNPTVVQKTNSKDYHQKKEEKGFLSSMFDFIVNKRVRRTSTRANCGYSHF